MESTLYINMVKSENIVYMLERAREAAHYNDLFPLFNI
jgi:hypothetical protein